MGDSFYARLCFLETNREEKGERRRLGPGIIIGRFGGQYAIVHFRGAYLEVDLDDVRSENWLLEVIGCDGELRLQLPSTKSPIHYLVGVSGDNLPFRNEKWDFAP